MLIPNMGGERSVTQMIIAKLIKASNELKQAFFYLCTQADSPKTEFKKSTLDVRKTKFLIAQGYGFPNGEFGGKIGRVTGAEH